MPKRTPPDELTPEDIRQYLLTFYEKHHADFSAAELDAISRTRDLLLDDEGD